MKRYPCPCCGYKTFDDEPDGSYEICPVCFWEDDLHQLNHPDDAGGANRVSLRQAQKNFLEFGASDKEMLEKVRGPLPGEERDANWKFLAE